jgi:hypothetical protein
MIDKINRGILSYKLTFSDSIICMSFVKSKLQNADIKLMFKFSNDK